MNLLAIETSCDETAAAVLQDTQVLSSIRYTQSEHGVWGGVVPSIAKREHELRILPIINEALDQSGLGWDKIDAIAVTVGPGLAIALEVGIKTAKELAELHHKKLIAVNHVEGHILSPLINLKLEIRNLKFPLLALVVSGGHTELDLVKNIGEYQILAETIDDALGEALDKAARLLNMPYPGAAQLEKAASLGDPKKFRLPLPMAGREDQLQFSYSGLKAAFARLVNEQGLEQTSDLAACFQARAFQHLTRIVEKTVEQSQLNVQDLLVGGGVIANQKLRQELLDLGQRLGLTVHFANLEVTGDNAAMIGLAGYYKALKNQFVTDFSQVDRFPRLRVDQPNY